MNYIQGYLLAVSTANKEAYRKVAEDFWLVARDHGCLAVVENWGVDVPDGELTSFPMAVRCKPDEVVVFSWTEWADKQACDTGWAAIMQDPRMKDQSPETMPFDGARMMWGGFVPLVSRRVGEA